MPDDGRHRTWRVLGPEDFRFGMWREVPDETVNQQEELGGNSDHRSKSGELGHRTEEQEEVQRHGNTLGHWKTTSKVTLRGPTGKRHRIREVVGVDAVRLAERQEERYEDNLGH